MRHQRLDGSAVGSGSGVRGDGVRPHMQLVELRVNMAGQESPLDEDGVRGFFASVAGDAMVRLRWMSQLSAPLLVAFFMPVVIQVTSRNARNEVFTLRSQVIEPVMDTFISSLPNGIESLTSSPLESLFSRDFSGNDYEALLALDEGIISGRGASDTDLASLPPAFELSAANREHAAYLDTDTSCPICLETLVAQSVVRVLPCGGKHVFHGECIDQWLRLNAVCPMCKESVK